jgi:Fic family protein
MVTLRFLSDLSAIPMETAWYLTDLAEAKGRLQHLTQAAPQRLRALHEAALAESAHASNRIEGLGFDASGGRELIFGGPRLHNPREGEVRRYRAALALIHGSSAGSSDRPAVSEETVLELHRLVRGQADDGGHYRQEDLEILEKGPDGRARRLTIVSARETPEAMGELVDLWNRFGNRTIPPLLALAAFNLDFLNIHPFRDGTGRVARLLFVLQCCRLGIDVVRYVSIERTIEENRERYYETLEESSRGWHRGAYSSWPYLNYMLFIVKQAYRELEKRFGQTGARRGEKSEVVIAAINRMSGDFSIADLLAECPGAGADWVRHILQTLRQSGTAECLGRGRSARWRRLTRVE